MCKSDATGEVHKSVFLGSEYKYQNYQVLNEQCFLIIKKVYTLPYYVYKNIPKWCNYGEKLFL